MFYCRNLVEIVCIFISILPAIAENTQAITMQALFESWIEFVKVAKEITPKWMRQHETRWNRHLKNPLGKLLAKDITRVHLASVLDGMY